MKKTLSLLLVFAFCLSICACGNKNSDASNEYSTTKDATTTEPTVAEVLPSKAELMATAEIFDHAAFKMECLGDATTAAQKCIGKSFKVMGAVREVGKDYVRLLIIDSSYEASWTFGYNVYLPVSELATVREGDLVAAVGQATAADNGTLVLENAYTFPVFEYLENQIDPMIEIFGVNDGDNVIEDTDGSYGFFRFFHYVFPRLKGYEIQKELIGTWNVAERNGDQYVHTFNTDGSAIRSKSGTSNNCFWLVDGNSFYWSSHDYYEIDPETNTRYEIRRLNDDTLIVYENDIGNYNGMRYNADSPYVILVRN